MHTQHAQAEGQAEVVIVYGRVTAMTEEGAPGRLTGKEEFYFIGCSGIRALGPLILEALRWIFSGIQVPNTHGVACVPGVQAGGRGQCNAVHRVHHSHSQRDAGWR